MSDVTTEALHEGPEPAPRGVRLMAVVRWMLLAIITVTAVATVWRFWGPGAQAAVDHREARYYCPMHPQITSPDPGECPICHMNLEPIPAERRGGTPAPAGSHVHGTPSVSAATTPAPAPAPGACPTEGTGTSPGDCAVPGLVPVTVTLDRQQLVGVSTSVVQAGTSGENLRVPAAVEVPQNSLAQVHVRAPGFIERIAVRETGVRVSRGQPLAWIYSPQIYQAQMEMLTANRWATQPAIGSGEHGDHGVGQLSVSQPGRMVSAGRASLELLGMAPSDIDAVLRSGEPMRRVPVRAPAPGYITRREAVLGMYATEERVLYEIADLSRVWVVASVYDRDLGQIRRGMPARFHTEGGEVAAHVSLIEPEVGQETRTARVRLEIANAGMALRPGQYGDVLFDLPGTRTLTVPRDAVMDTGEAQYVFVVGADGRFEPRRVRTGALVGDAWQVREGLRDGERVVTRGAFMIDSESRLQAALSGSSTSAAGPPPAAGAHAGHGG